MNQDFLSKLPAALLDAVTRFSEQPDRDIQAFLTAEVGEAVAGRIGSVVGRIEDHSREVSQARSEGRSAAHWLGGVIEQTGAGPALRSIPGLIGDATESPIDAARQLLTAGTLGLGGLEASAAPQGIFDGLVAGAPVTELVGRFLESPLGHGVEAQLTSIASAAAARLAKSMDQSVDTVGLVANIDLGLRIAKVGFKVANGDFDIFEATDLIEDRLAAGLAAVAGEAFERGIAEAGLWLGTALDTYLCTPGLMANIGETVGTMAGSRLRPLVEQGTKTVTRTLFRGAKALAKQAAGKVGAFARKLATGLLG